jgi:polysaccharide deacetylase family protein (PEP-CTERM system associated)
VSLKTTALPPAPDPPHIFSVDVEDYFQVSAFEGIVSRDRWDSYPSRVERNTDVLLELLARHRVHGTFFTLGWVAQHFPGLVRRIVAAGHEIASHGHWHRRVSSMSAEEFRQDIREAKQILEQTAGQPVQGYRAPTFSILPGLEWAFDVLLEEGYRYDSSLFPIWRPGGYGYAHALQVPHLIERKEGALLELPMAITHLFGLRTPAAGGGYLRQLPYAVAHRAFGAWSERGVSAMFYIHPWEVDLEQPRLPAGWLTRRRHYGGLERTMPRLERLLSEFRWTSVARRFGGVLPAAAAGRAVG